MDAERWRQISLLYHAARARADEERYAFLDSACGGDHALRHEVESLLARDTRGDAFLVVPAAEAFADLANPDAAEPGRTLGSYRIERLLGRGGMGIVYLAYDTTLHRRVALKVIDRPVDGETSRTRLLREARNAAALNHPNICTIHEVGDASGSAFIAMEYVEGRSLRDRIDEGALPLEEAVRDGIQAADALAYAHDHGVIHRDFKAANAIVTEIGRLKVVDFGLARRGDALMANATTMASLVPVGAAAGTPYAMAPEQVRGEATDARTDVWALGVLLYEMMTAAQPFKGATIPELFSSILRDSPAPMTDAVPVEMRALIERCLDKEPERRFQHAGDVRAALEAIQSGTLARPVASRDLVSRRLGLVSAASLLGLALFAAGYFYFHRTPRLTDKDTIVLADFANTTGDPVFDGTLRQGLAIQLAQSPFLSLVSDERIRQTLLLMGRPADAPLTQDVAREICERTAGAAVLEGTVQRLGTEYVLGLRAKTCRTGEVLDEQQVQAARKEDVLNALSDIATKFRTRVGESLATVERHETPLAEATTPSLEALKSYSAAVKAAFSTGLAAGVPLLKRAVEIDPKFAMAHAYLGLWYSDMGESALSTASTSKAYQLRDRASDREKFFITANYDRQVTGNLEKAQQTCELWAETYPREVLPHGLSSGFICQGAGKFEQSIEEAKKAIALDPDLTPAYVNLAFSYFYLDRLGEAESILQGASERKLETPELLLLRYYIAFLKGDRGGMDREAARAKGKPGAEDWISHSEALVLARGGQLQLSRDMSHRAVDLAQRAGQPERAALFETGAAVWEGFVGNAAAARQHATEALQLSKARDVEYGAAFALALAGDSSRSEALANDLERRFPEDTSVRFAYLPTLRGLFALNRGAAANAIERLRIATPYEVAVPGIDFNAFFGGLYPVYVRGAAYLAAHQGAEAATEFQKILDHRGIVAGDPIGALAHLQLGRAFALSGDETKAKAAYRDFFTLWKDADPDIPILEQARTEYAKRQ